MQIVESEETDKERNSTLINDNFKKQELKYREVVC